MGDSCRPEPAAPFPILVKLWAGGDPHDMRYIRRSIPSLLESHLGGQARVFLADDCSPDPALAPFARACANDRPHVTLLRTPKRLGPNAAHAYLVPRVIERVPGAPFYVFCDDDVIYHPEWLTRLVATYREATARGIRGVFTALNVSARPAEREVDLSTSRVLLKRRQFALNWLVPADVYREVGPFGGSDVAYDTDYCARLADRGLWVICLKPSYAQNIGYRGFYQTHNHHADFFARDFVGKVDWRIWFEDLYWRVDRRLGGLDARVRRRLQG